MHRYRIVFSRDHTLKYVGHLDLAKTWERVLRRADMPIAYSQGFHPQPRITFASALPVGCTSEAEMMDVVLTEQCGPGDWVGRLAPALPPGITIRSVEEVDLQWPALQAQLRRADYIVVVQDHLSMPEAQSRVEAFLASPSAIRERRGKTYDLRPLVLALHVDKVDSTGVWLGMRLMADSAAGTARPDEVLAALGWADCPAQIHRRALGFAGDPENEG